MDDTKTKDLIEMESISSDIGAPEHEESTPSSAISQPNHENRNKKNLPTDIECASTSIDTSSAHDTQDAAEFTEASIDGEDFVLRVESSDNETFEDAVEVIRGPKEIKIDDKCAISKKSETFFSDIESSDDSIAYESEGKLGVSKEVNSGDKETTPSAVNKAQCEEKKVIEPEFDPVESDEEFFEDPPLPEGTEQISQESLSTDKSFEAEERNTTPLIDEEIGDSTELNLDTEEVIETKASKSNPEPEETIDIKLESSVEIQKEIVPRLTESINPSKDEISTELETSQDLFEDDSAEVDDEVTLNSLAMDETKIVSPTSLLAEEETEKCSPNESDSPEKDMVVSENTKPTDETMNPPEVSSKDPSPDEKTEKFEEALPNDNSEITSVSSILVEDKNMSPAVLPEIMDTDIEMTEEINSKDDDLKAIESCASVSEPVEIDEPMQIDETSMEVSGLSEMDTNEIETMVEKTDKSLCGNEPQISIETKIVVEISLKVNETSEEREDILDAMENISNADEQLNRSMEKTSTALSEIEPDEVDENLMNTKPDEIVSSQDLQEMKKIEEEEKSSEAGNSNKRVPHNDSIEDLPVIDADEKKSDDDLLASPEVSADDGILLVESTARENLKENNKEAAESLKKPDNVNKSPIKVPEETENLEEIIPSSLDDPKAIKDVTDCDQMSVENNEKSSKTSIEEPKEDAQTPVEIENTDLDETSLEKTENILDMPDKSIEKAAELNEKEEYPKEIEVSAQESVICSSDSPKKIEESLQKSVATASESLKEFEESAEKSIASASDSTEKIESPKKSIKTSEESNKQLSASIENNESSKEIVKISSEPLATEESPQQIAETSEKSTQPTKDSNEKEETVNETVVLVDLSEDSNKQSEDTEESPKPPVVVEKSDEPKSILNEQESFKEIDESKEIVEPKDTADSKEPKEIQVTEESSEVISSNIETLSEIIEIPEVAIEVLVEKVVEVETVIESTNSKETSLNQDAKKSSSVVDPEIIEIDDDDDLEEEKKLEDSKTKHEKAPPSSTTTTEKESSDKTNEDKTIKTTENKESNDCSTPMEIDEEITKQIPSQPPIEVQPSDQDTNKVPESAINDADGKLSDKVSLPVQVLDDDEEPLLMIDTSHKEDNDNESIMDNETATSAPTTDSSSDGSLEVFYEKECINYECKRASKNYFRATVFSLNYFKISKKRTKAQFVCEDCYDRALGSYEELCKTLKQKQPLLHGTSFKCQEFVEIIDSSDEEESDAGADKIKDENTLPKESIEMLEAELEGAIRKVMHNVDIQKQLSWTKQILQQRLTNLQEDSDFVTEQLRALQRKADQMHNSLYQCPKIKLRQLTPLDLNSGRMYSPETDNSTSMPPPGEIVRTPICVNEQYYAVKTKAIASWVPCKVIEEVEAYPVAYNQLKTYKIRFTKLAKYPMFKTVYAKHIAYYDPPNVRLPIGSRVIAYFDATSLSRGKEKMLIPSAFYPGIIAEPLKQSNKFRYLVFYDDGYFQYVNHKDVRLVCQASENVWEDVHHQSREFIHNYLTQYAVNRPMVQTQKGQSMLVDYNGKWIYARVIDVDCSLVQMLFEGQSRSEWIYRGSTRLGPVYKESNNLSQKNTLNATRRRTEPFIRYINGDDSSSSQQVQESEQSQAKAGSNEIRSVAKKSVSRVDTSNNNNSTTSSAAQTVPTVRHLNNSTIFVDDDNKPKGKVVYYTARKNLPPRDYVPHICNPACPFNITHNLTFYSPLAKPLLSGWERQVFRQKSKKFIIYRGPCGKRMRNIEELHRYLRVTDNELNVDNFDFSPDTNCLAEYVLEKCLVNKKDISVGKEKMPIPCVNYYDESMPPACEYSAVRIPTEGVPLNLDEEFLCGCDCEDDCSDKTKCACWQLTYAGAKYGMPSVPTEMVGYQYKRLYEHVPTGIYECNSRCKCKSNCVNRVVQQPLQSKLQVFKTSNRGWGLRCINDVPRGSFICVYAGQMLTEQVANEGGLDAGDEYFAELDYIEVAEQIKEGYESDVHEPDEEEELYNPEREDDDTDFRASLSHKDKEFNTRLRARRGNKNSTDGECESQERQVISFEPNKNMDTSTEPNEKPTIRKLFGKDESCYVMDAKVRGNLGRYFNHSCSPNLFVQNVFVDTHDLRFPWVAFFASTHIRAGTELTWNYNYEVGVVPGKVLYCQCGAPNCRQRLL